MAKESTLKNGSKNQFRLVGKAIVRDGSFNGGTQAAGSTWVSVNDSFGVEITEGNTVWPRIKGGHSLRTNLLYKRRRTPEGKTEMAHIPLDKRFEESLQENLTFNSFRHANIVPGEEKKFLDDIDYTEYLANNLPNGAEIVVTGEVSYSPGAEGAVYRNYEVRNIYLNPLKTDDQGNTSLQYPHTATIEQTYLIDEYSLDNPKRELQEDGKITVRAYAPFYLGQLLTNGEWIDFKKVAPLIQTFVIQPKNAEQHEKALKLADRLFKVKRGVVREINLENVINEGFEMSTGNVEISSNLQELIDLGLIEEEEIKKKTKVRGPRVSELIFNQIIPIQVDGVAMIGDDEKYSPDALIMPTVDTNEEDAPFSLDDEPATVSDTTAAEKGLDDDMLDGLFEDL